MPSFRSRMDQWLFPTDMTMVASRGLLLDKSSYEYYRLSMLIFSMSLQTLLMMYGPDINNFTYLTYWGFTATSLYFLVASLENLIRRVYGKAVGNLWKLPHFLFPDVLCIQVIINCIYWMAFFPTMVKENKHLNWIDITQAIGAHFIPLLMLIIDLINNIVCFENMSRSLTTCFILLLYLIVNAAYSLSVSAVYQLITFKSWITYVLVVGCVVAVFLWYGIMRIYSRFWKEPRLRIIMGRPQKNNGTLSDKPCVFPVDSTSQNRTMVDNMNKGVIDITKSG